MIGLFLLLLQQAAMPAQVPALQDAIRHNSSTAAALLESGADPNLPDAHGRTPLLVAVATDGLGKQELIRLLLSKGADPNARDDSGASPLDVAAWMGSIDRVQLLLDGGAKIDAVETKTGATPLNEAAFMGHTGVVMFLLTHGADVSIRDHAGFLPVENALREHHIELMGLLLKQQKDPSLVNRLLEEAVRRGQEDTAVFLLDAGAAIDAPFSSGSNALYDASLKGDERIVSLLVGRGANVNEREKTSLTTPLYAAAAFGRERVVATLLLWGADPKLVGKEGLTPLHAAEANGYKNIAEQIRAASPISRQ